VSLLPLLVQPYSFFSEIGTIASYWVRRSWHQRWANVYSPLQLFPTTVGANHHSPGRSCM